MNRRKAIEIALRRRLGASPEARERIRQAHVQWTDWQATCRVCGASLRGSMADLSQHQHNNDEPGE